MTKQFDERNMAKSRRVCEAMAEAASTGKRVLTERERQILDMWPRFEDGEPAWYGDEVDTMRSSVIAIEFFDGSITLSSDFDHLHLSFGERVKRPAPKVLDADGVEIKAGDTVWRKGKPTEYKVAIVIDGVVYLTYKTSNGDNSTTTIFARKLTHTRPDSWERLAEDATKNYAAYWGCGMSTCAECPKLIDGKTPYERFGCLHCLDAMRLDLIRRAKRLAGIEVD